MEGILNGIRVLDLTEGLAGAYCTMNLGDFGAEVIKVELPAGDRARSRGPMKQGVSAVFAGVNRNKKSVCLDYTTAEGRTALLKMAEQCDIFVENSAPGACAALGLGYGDVKAVNPGVIYASLTGYGTTGPLRDHPVDDLVVTAMSGLMDRTGRRGEPPMMPGVDVGCIYSGVTLLSGIAMALYHRLSSGEGAQIEVSMLDSVFYMLELFVMNYSVDGSIVPKNGNQDTEVAPLGTFAAKDGLAAIAVSSEGQWKKFCALTGADRLADDPRFADNAARIRNLEALTEELGQITGRLGKQELAALLCENKLAGGALQSVAELTENPQALATEMIVRTAHPQAGELFMVGSPMKLGLTPVDIFAAPAPALGQHTEEVLQELGVLPA